MMTSSFEIIQPNSLNQLPSKSWSCDICTYLNKSNIHKCELCLTPKPINPFLKHTTISPPINPNPPLIRIAKKNIDRQPPSQRETIISLNTTAKHPQKWNINPHDQDIGNYGSYNPKQGELSFDHASNTSNLSTPPTLSNLSSGSSMSSISSINSINSIPEDIPLYPSMLSVDVTQHSQPKNNNSFQSKSHKKRKALETKPKLTRNYGSKVILPMSISNQKVNRQRSKRFHLKKSNSDELIIDENIATVYTNIKSVKCTTLYKLPAQQHKTSNNIKRSHSRNFSLGGSVYSQFKSQIQTRTREQSLPVLKIYERNVQKHESVLLQSLKCNDINDQIINTVMDARCDVLCQFLPLIAFTLIRNNNNDEIKWKLLNKLRERIIGQSDLRQAVTFLVRSYENIDWVQLLFKGLCLGKIKNDGCDFWYKLLNKKKLKENDSFIIPPNMILRDPVKQLCSPIKKVIVNKIINSNSKPLLLSCYGENNKLSSTVILKSGDDLRKDKACMLFFKWINHMFSTKSIKSKRSALRNVKILTYNVIPMSRSIGCIELIQDCIPLRDIESLKEDIMFDKRGKLLNNLIHTAAGSYIASYLIGVRDRHFDNILIRETDCTLFHIDMNYVLGDTINGLDANKFGITREFYDLLGKQNYKKFVDLACDAFIELRHNCKELMNFACLCFSYVYQKKSIKRYIAKQLRTNESDHKSAQWLKTQLKNAPFCKQTKLKNVIHKFATR